MTTMKYLIITYDEYLNIPYVNNYEQCLRNGEIDYDMVLWNRSEKASEEEPGRFVFEGKTSKSKISKVIPFLRWRAFVLKILKKNKYDRVIVLTTIPGVLLFDKLIGQYKKRYWFDVRDYTYESLPLYKKAVEKLVLNSAVTSISSEAFSSFLPDCDHIVLTHNITNDAAMQEECSLDIGKTPLTIAFVGGIQYVQQNKRLLQQFSNDPRFVLKYIGKTHPGCDLQSFCRENEIDNVAFLPAYRNEEKPQIYRTIDMINCVYGSDSPIVKLALPNKLYDCILFKKPIIVSKDTFLAEIVEEYGVGLAVDVDRDDVPAMVEDYLSKFNHKDFEIGCNRLLKKVQEESALCQNVMKRFCSEKGSYEFISKSDPVL